MIPNGIDPGERPAPGAIAAPLLQGHPRITFVGRLEWEKGVFTAVQAMPAVLAQHPDALLRMVGTGSQQDALRAAILDAGVTHSVELLGHVDEQTLADVYASSDVVIAPSSYEPFGIVALEAAAAGVPLVVGDTAGLAEFVTDPRGPTAPSEQLPPGSRARSCPRWRTRWRRHDGATRRQQRWRSTAGPGSHNAPTRCTRAPAGVHHRRGASQRPRTRSCDQAVR